MTPLEELSIATPRADAVCKRYARRMDPWWGFVIAGVIWWVCVMSMTTVAMIKISDSLGYAAGSSGAKKLSMIALPIAFALTIFGFVWWRRRRLGTKEKLVRDGDLVDVEVTGRPFQLGGSKTRTAVDLVGADRELRCVFNRWFLPAKGDTIKLLNHRGVAHVVAFDRDGAMYSGHVR